MKAGKPCCASQKEPIARQAPFAQIARPQKPWPDGNSNHKKNKSRRQPGIKKNKQKEERKKSDLFKSLYAIVTVVPWQVSVTFCLKPTESL